jgi:predicted MPP superfamily phosphohydrolase
MALYGALNYYIGLRGWQLFGNRLSVLHATLYWSIFIVIVLSSFVAVMGKKFLPDFLREIFSFIGSYWIAAMVYFTLFIVMIDLLRLVDRRLGLLRVFKNNSNYTLTLGLLIIAFVIGLLVYGTWNAKNIKVTSYQIHISKSAGVLKQLYIVMISDLHLNDIGVKRRRKIIETVNRLHPELVLIPGDIVPPETNKIAADFLKIRSKYGVYACLGNHDYYGGDLTNLVNQLQQAGMKVLRDSGVKVGDSFYIIGRDDKTYEGMSKKKRQALSNIMIGINRQLPVIMMDHQPIDIEEARNAGVDLQLSGHTHRGQFFPFNLITNKIFKIDYGYLKTGNLQVIVSSGAGTWGPPIRIGSSSEVVDIKIIFQ